MNESRRPGYLLTVDWPITSPGGVNEVVLSLAKQLKLSGYDPVIAASRSESKPVRGTEIVELGIEPPFTTKSRLKPFIAFLVRFPTVAWRLLAFLKQRNIRTVNAHYPDLSVYAFLILQKLRLYKGTILLSFHGSDVQGLIETRGLQRAAWQFLLRQVDGNTACSEALRSLLLTFAPSAKVTTIYNACDIDLFLVEKRPNRKRRTILQVAKFEAKKGQDVTLRAVDLLRKTVPDIRLILVGAEGPGLEATRKLISELKLGECTELHLNVAHETVAEYMRHSDILVLSSRIEPFGIVLLEAGASNLPVVASRVGGIPELIENEVTGLLVSAGDPMELERALLTLALDDEKATRMANLWHEKATSKWTWEASCAKYIELSKDRRKESSEPTVGHNSTRPGPALRQPESR